MSRIFPDWLSSFVDYGSVAGEAPRRFYFWSGVSAIAGALQRKVWIDMKRFMWYPNFFIILVAPPGVATKSTTADVGSKLLIQIPGVKDGPNNITWQALATAFANAKQEFPYNGEYWPMSAITLVARELGSLLNPRDPDLINLLIELWDGAPKYEKETKMSGNDLIICPWINIIGCTTPSWIADNVPVQALRGGFISRCVFLYAEDKEKPIPYPDEAIPFDEAKAVSALVQDLTAIGALVGPFVLTKEAREWGRPWYKKLWADAKEHMNDDQIMGFVSRKQTHAHKLAMIFSAAQGDSMKITDLHLQLAVKMLDDLEGDMNKVFAAVGKSEISVQTDRALQYVRRRKECPYQDMYRFIHSYFPNLNDFEGIVGGLVRAGYVQLFQKGSEFWLKYSGD